MIDDIERITIPLEEYKELLTIKGKYEELKSMYYGPYTNTKITYRGESEKEITPPYKFTCDNSSVTFNKEVPHTYTNSEDLEVQCG